MLLAPEYFQPLERYSSTQKGIQPRFKQIDRSRVTVNKGSNSRLGVDKLRGSWVGSEAEGESNKRNRFRDSGRNKNTFLLLHFPQPRGQV